MTAHELENMPFGQFHHLGIVVPATAHDEVVETMCTLVGGRVVETGFDDPLDIRWTFVGGTPNPIIEIASPEGTDETPISRFLQETGGGLHHASFEANDIQECIQNARSSGLPVVAENPNHGGWSEFFISPKVTGGAIMHCMKRLEGE